jgi:hypothetical protein
MRIPTLALAVSASLFFGVAAYAQDWADDLTDAPKVLDDTFVPKNVKHLTLPEAKVLIQKTLELQDDRKYVDDPNFYCLINVVNWKSDAAATDSSAWFVYRGGKHWNAVNLEAARVYGGRNLAVLYLHLVQAVNDPAATEFDTFKTANPTADVDTMRSSYQAGRLNQFQDASGRTLKRVGGVTYVSGYPPTQLLDYRIEVTRKTIAPFQHAVALLGAVGQAGGAAMKLTNRTIAIWAGKLFDIQYSTSDILVKSLLGADRKELDKKTIDNEGNYHFDVSAAIPIRGIKQLQYDSTNFTATPKTVTSINAYGLLNLFFKAMDVKTNYTVWPPSLVAGVGLTGKPFDKPLLGLGFGYGKVSGFAGCVFNKVSQPGATPGSIDSHRERKFVFGVNISARQVADLLKKK